MACHLQSLSGSRAPKEESALPKVASDPVVPRPLRPESGSGRAGAPKPSESFEGMLETSSSDAPRAARAERATPNRGSERADAASNSTKPAETPTTRQAKNGQPSNTAETNTQPADAAVAVAEIPSAPAIAFAAAIEALAAGTECEAAPEIKDADTAAATDPNADAGDPAISVAAGGTAKDIAPIVIAAVVTPVPAPVTALAAVPNIDPAAVAAVDLEAAPAAPVKADPQAPADPADAPATDSAKPQAAPDATVEASVDQTAPRDDSQKTAALKAATADEAPEAKSPAPADHKGEPARANPEQHAPARPTDAPAPRDAAAPAEAPADPQAPAPHHPQAQASEHAAPAARSTLAERPELPATAAAAAQVNASTPPPPFNLATHIASPVAASPLTALRVDNTADSAIPVAGLAVEIVSRAMDGHRRFEIRLDPPELGRIDVRLDVDHGGKVTSRLMVERAETLDLLRRDAPQLERALQHAGLNTEGGLEFSLRDQNFANREQAPRDANAARLIVPDDEAVAAEAARRGYGRMIGLGGGVDIRV